MTSAHTAKLAFATLTTAVLIAVMSAFIFVTPNSALAAEPERPTDLTATAIDHDTVSLTWSHPNPASVDHYQVLSRRVDSGAGITQAGTSTTTSFEHDGLEPESTYFYRVRPVNSQGEEGQRSARAEATTPAEETPAPPQRSDGEDQGNIARSSHDVLVSNTGQTSQNTTISQDSAQTFTTGTTTAGYVLTSVVIGYNDTAGDTFSTAVWTTNSSGLPNALKHSLTAPTTFSQGDLTFNAPANATLDASTTYTVVMMPSSGNVTSKRTSTENPDEDSGAAVGWSIGDTYHFKAGGVFIASSSNKPILIAIHGTLSTASDDATLSDLVVNDGTDDLSPDPAFDPATLGYSVEVDHDVDEVTVTPTLNDTGASYEIQDDEGAALTDVDTTQDDFQVSISPGPNTINVVITGADGHTTQTYTVTVQRINILVSNIDQTTAVAIAVGNNGSAQIKHAQKFTTGSNTSGYTLYDVKLFLDSSASSEPIVTVNTADGNNPGTLLYNLTAKDSSLTLDGPRRFTANAGATLEASTSYFIVAANSTSTRTAPSPSTGRTTHQGNGWQSNRYTA